MLESMEPEGKTADICKPDYEKQIRDLKERLGKVLNLKDALFDYVGIGRTYGKLAEMIGELVSEQRFIENRIVRLIEQQAAQK